MGTPNAHLHHAHHSVPGNLESRTRLNSADNASSTARDPPDDSQDEGADDARKMALAEALLPTGRVAEILRSPPASASSRYLPVHEGTASFMKGVWLYIRLFNV